jgi:multiple sugar transport system permease protein
MTTAKTHVRRGLAVRESVTAYGLLTPALLGVLAFLIVPIIMLVVLSFADWNVLSPIEFVGLKNWEWALSSGVMWHSFGVTALFVVLVVPVQLAAGLLLAVLLVRNLPGSAVLRTLLVLPWVSAPVVLGIVWRWLLQYGGVLDDTFGANLGLLSRLCRRGRRSATCRSSLCQA